MFTPILSISILVSNRIDTVKKTMESVKRIMDRVPSELIVVDTVGEEKTDGSLFVAKEYATKIVHFDWINDFAAARNAGLKEASGEWFMFLDDDEEFKDIEDIVSFFEAGEYKKYNSATYKLHDYTDDQGHYIVADMQRMVKRLPETAFKGRIHEYISPMRLPVKELQSFAEHHGYVFKTHEDQVKKFERNFPLIEGELKEDPWNVRIRLHFIQACMSLPEYVDRADRACVETIDADTDKISMESVRTSYYQWILCAYVRIATQGEDDEEILRRIDKVRSTIYLSELSKLALAIMEIKVATRAEILGRIENDLAEIEKNYTFLKNDKEALFFQKSLDQDLFMNDGNVLMALRYGISTLRKAGFERGSQRENIFRNAFGFYRNVQNKPVLSVQVLVSKDRESVERCFKSIVPLKEMTDCEIVAVDTLGAKRQGGLPETVKKYADRIVDHDWTCDFSAARNAGLKEVNAEWFMYIDDDEEMDDVKETAEFFSSAEYIDYNSAAYTVRNYMDKGGTAFTDAVLPRMVRVSEETRFENVIDEELHPFSPPCKYFKTIIKHYGYIFEKEEERQNHASRKQAYLERAVKEHPESLEVRAQYADDVARHDAEKGICLVRDIISEFERDKENPWYQLMISVLFRLHESVGTPVSSVIEEYRSLRQSGVCGEYAGCAAASEVTRICLLQDFQGGAGEFATDYFAGYEKIKSDPEKYSAELKGDLKTFTEDDVHNEMLYFGTAAFLTVNDVERAWKSLTEMPWEDPGFKQGADSLGLLFYTNSRDERCEYLFGAVRNIMRNPAIKPAFTALLQSNPAAKAAVDRCLEAMAGKR